MDLLGENLTHVLVVDFLKRFKALADADRIHFYDRDSTIATLTHLGVTFKQAKAAIMGLRVSNYYRGIGTPRKRADEEICEFGIEGLGIPVYVKLEIDNKRKKAFCISFHVAKWQMEYPLADKEER